MDIYEGGDNYAIGYTQEGEWLEYTVDVVSGGAYGVSVNYASGSESSGLSLLLDDKEIVPPMTLSKTGEDWSVYKTENLGNFDLEAGKHVLKILITGNYVNIDWLEFFHEYVSVRPKFMASQVSATYDVFDMLGAHVGRIEARTVQDVPQKVRALVKPNGTYLAKSRNGSATIRVIK